MGAGARLAEERALAGPLADADLEPEEEHLLDLLAPGRGAAGRGAGVRERRRRRAPVLIGVTDRQDPGHRAGGRPRTSRGRASADAHATARPPSSGRTTTAMGTSARLDDEARA